MHRYYCCLYIFDDSFAVFKMDYFQLFNRSKMKKTNTVFHRKINEKADSLINTTDISFSDREHACIHSCPPNMLFQYQIRL